MAYSPRPTSTPTEGTRPRVLNATRARQGRFGRHMLWVLVISTALAALALAGAWAWKAPGFARASSGNGPAQSGPTFHAPPPAAPTPP
jgi:hypothetical protein